MPDRIQSLLAPHLARKEELLRQIAGWEVRLADMRMELRGVEQRIQGIRETAELLQGASGRKPRKGQRRQRGMSAHWQRILQLVDVMEGDQFTYKALSECAEGAGHAASSDTLRSQMSDYKNRGWVESVGFGAFRLTDEGRAAAGIQMKTPGAATPGVKSDGPEAELDGSPAAQHPAANRESVGSNPTGSAPSYNRPPESWEADNDIPF